MQIQQTTDFSKLENNETESVYKLFKETHKQKSVTKKKLTSKLPHWDKLYGILFNFWVIVS